MLALDGVKIVNWKNGILRCSLASLVLGAFTGCEPVRTPAAFEPNHVFARKLTLQFEDLQTEDEATKQPIDLMEQPLKDSYEVLVAEFGQPEKPQLPAAFKSIEGAEQMIDLKRMEPATFTGDEKHGLYRKHCVTCHGESGSGRGLTAASQNPYPRDFRFGEFKFKTTPRGSKPTRQDLKRVVRGGLPGSQMPAFDKLTEAEIEGLVDYVLYLSIRGQVEREMLLQAAMQIRDGDVEDGEKIAFQELFDEKLAKVAGEWVKAESEVESFSPPENLPIDGMTPNPDAALLNASIEKGKSLFHGAIANCSKCHGENGNGAGTQDADFDDFTKEWTVQANMDPKNLTELHPLLAMGALPPQTTPPRKLNEGQYRGGREPMDLFYRIRYGINKTPMPSAALANANGEGGLTNDDMWHLVNYVRSLAPSP